MRIGVWGVAAAVIMLLGDVETALAWGPGTHVALAGSILERLSLLPTAVGAVLARHAIAYIYGSIAADVVFAKRLSRIRQFCHHWSTGFRLLETAGSDRDRSFAYGYLSHLAADTVAHGKYVPRQIVVSDCTVGFGHLYWELRADTVQGETTWARLADVLDYDHEDHHRALECHIFGTFLPYQLNRRLFDRMNALTVRPVFRRTVHVWSRCSRWYLSPELLADYEAECVDRIESVLTQQDRSAVLRDDPNGTSALMRLRVRRRESRRLRLMGFPVKPRALEASRGLAPSPLPDRAARRLRGPAVTEKGFTDGVELIHA